MVKDHLILSISLTFLGNKKSRKQEINFVPFYNFRKNKLQKYKVLVE